ncbi:MAG: hypothetical protein HYV59_02010 [Planctomycetes bacterium]|nr:hypothetical protein [Planctomycetota bacterium]
MKINCILCGHNFDLNDDAYNDYEGDVKCWVCGGVLDIKLQEGKLKSLKYVKTPRPVSEETRIA